MARRDLGLTQWEGLLAKLITVLTVLRKMYRHLNKSLFVAMAILSAALMAFPKWDYIKRRPKFPFGGDTGIRLVGRNEKVNLLSMRLDVMVANSFKNQKVSFLEF